VGPDGSVLYLASSLRNLDDGVKAYRSGTRTPRELFGVFEETRPTRQ
jgi:hypothetical protein